MGIIWCLYLGNLHTCGVFASIKATQHGVELDTGVASDSYGSLSQYFLVKLEKFTWSAWRNDQYNSV